MHLDLKTGPLCPIFCTKLDEPCSFSKVYVIMWVWIWWVLLWCGCIEFVYNCTVWFCISL